jgi:hypothetical protein
VGAAAVAVAEGKTVAVSVGQDLASSVLVPTLGFGTVDADSDIL